MLAVLLALSLALPFRLIGLFLADEAGLQQLIAQ